MPTRRLPPWIQFLVVFCAGWVNRQQQDLIEYLRTENSILKELFGGKPPRLNDGQRRRLAVMAHGLDRGVLAGVASIVSPDTLRRWFKKFVREKYDGTGARGPGRPRTLETTANMIVRLAKENETWGYTRIRDELPEERRVARSTVVRVLRENGIVPAPERSRRTSWRDFLAAHWDGAFGADFFTVEVLTFHGLVRYHVLFFMELKTRRVHVAGITSDLCEAWMMQVARNLTDAFDGFLRNAQLLILDRDPLFTAQFRRLLGDRGVKVCRLPRRSPNLNAFVERWVRSIRRECLDQIIPLGERHLQRAVSQYVIHYNRERVHQGLGHKRIDPERRLDVGPSERRLLCRVRLGGLLKYYYLESA